MMIDDKISVANDAITLSDVRIKIRHNPSDFNFQMLIFGNSNQGSHFRYVCKDIVFEKAEIGTVADDDCILNISRESILLLIEQLEATGVKPKPVPVADNKDAKIKGLEDELKATKLHLKDMRSLILEKPHWHCDIDGDDVITER